MRARTIFLSKLIGLYCILISLAMISHREATIETVTSLLQNQPALFMLGLIVMLSGLAIILAHNVWSGGALPVIVTLIGWLALMKGLFFLFLSPRSTSALILGGLHYAQYFDFYIAIDFVLGVYLTYAGFRSEKH